MGGSNLENKSEVVRDSRIDALAEVTGVKKKPPHIVAGGNMRPPVIRSSVPRETVDVQSDGDEEGAK